MNVKFLSIYIYIIIMIIIMTIYIYISIYVHHDSSLDHVSLDMFLFFGEFSLPGLTFLGELKVSARLLGC